MKLFDTKTFELARRNIHETFTSEYKKTGSIDKARDSALKQLKEYKGFFKNDHYRYKLCLDILQTRYHCAKDQSSIKSLSI